MLTDQEAADELLSTELGQQLSELASLATEVFSRAARRDNELRRRFQYVPPMSAEEYLAEKILTYMSSDFIEKISKDYTTYKPDEPETDRWESAGDQQYLERGGA